MQINEIDIEKYRDLSSTRKISFMQSPNWAIFKSQVSDYSYRFFEITLNGESIGSFLSLIKPKKLLGKVFNICYLPKVVFFNKVSDNTSKNISEVLNLLRDLYPLSLVELNSLYWEEDNPTSNEVNPEFIKNIFTLSGYTPTELQIQPACTVINDVTKTSTLEEYLSSLESRNAKRNIKKALKYMTDNNIKFEVKKSLTDSEMNTAYDLFEEVAKKSNFIGRSLEYYRTLQKTLSSEVLWYTMSKDGKLVLVNLAILDINTKTSNDLYVGKKIELEEGAISYALKYLSFKYLAETGYKYYDHWGVFLDPSSPKFGFSEFKIKFGGKIINFPPVLAYSKIIPGTLLNLAIKTLSNASL